MKHTIKLSLTEALAIESIGEELVLSIMVMGVVLAARRLSLDQVGACIFAMEQGAEVIEQARMLRRAQKQGAA